MHALFTLFALGFFFLSSSSDFTVILVEGASGLDDDDEFCKVGVEGDI